MLRASVRGGGGRGGGGVGSGIGHVAAGRYACRCGCATAGRERLLQRGRDADAESRYRRGVGDLFSRSISNWEWGEWGRRSWGLGGGVNDRGRAMHTSYSRLNVSRSTKAAATVGFLRIVLDCPNRREHVTVYLCCHSPQVRTEALEAGRNGLNGSLFLGNAILHKCLLDIVERDDDGKDLGQGLVQLPLLGSGGELDFLVQRDVGQERGVRGVAVWGRGVWLVVAGLWAVHLSLWGCFPERGVSLRLLINLCLANYFAGVNAIS